MVDVPEPDCWLHPDVEVRYSTSTAAAGFRMARACGSALCRRTITGGGP